jgi:MoxR-like ATPase
MLGFLAEKGRADHRPFPFAKRGEAGMTTSLAGFAERIITNVENVIVGKREQIELLLVAMLCQGHVLLEDVPGTGKTMLARSMARSMDLEFKRLQCTPDLLPNDITGVSIFLQHESRFEFRPGPLFVNILLADEINRATPRSQSALLEAMQERQVTIDGISHSLPRPFLVLATQNPIEFEGTFPLPEAQLDRFLIRLELGYPNPAQERQIIKNQRVSHPIDSLGPVVDGQEFLRYSRQVADIHLDESLESYILALIQASRSHPDLALGASPRGSLALYKTAQALAAVRDRDFVLPDDIKLLAPLTLAHRFIVKPESQLRGRTAPAILNDILEQTELAL